jgi:hypothetical protein
MSAQLLAFQNHDVEQVTYERPTPRLRGHQGRPALLENYLPNPGDFRTDYLLMDAFNSAVQRPEGALGVRQSLRPRVDCQ